MKLLYTSNNLGCVLLLALALSIQSTAKAAWALGEWYEGSNGYLYSVQRITGEVYTWGVARSQAQALTVSGLAVDLSPAASFEENNFIFYGINDPQYWNVSEGPYLGGYFIDEAPDYRWLWVTGELFTFTAWAPGQPDYAGGYETVLQYMLPGGLESAQDISAPKTWNDINFLGYQSQYYVARTTSAIPEPGVAGLFAGVGGFVLYFSRKRLL